MRALALLFAVGGCTQPALDYGRELFSSREVSTAGSNAFACSNCHEITADRQRVLPGYSMWNATRRPTWWGGFELTLLDAVNQCVTNFMRGRELSPSDEKARALHVYLDTLDDGAASPALPLTTVKDIVDLPSGESKSGKVLWDDACGNCHGAPHTGQGRLAGAVSIVPDETLKSFGTDPVKGARPITIEKVRHGKFFAVGGNMPAYSLEALTDDQLGDILAYLETFGLPPHP